MYESRNIVAIPPGETIHEQLESREMNQKEFAVRMGMSEKHISNLINGKVELTANVALKLEMVLGIPSSFWHNLEARYREKLARVKEELEIEKDETIAEKFPYAELAKLGWIAQTNKRAEKVLNLRKYFEVSKLVSLSELTIPGIAFRTAGENVKSDYSLAAWAQKAKLETRGTEVQPINIQRLKKTVPFLRTLTTTEPDYFCSELNKTLSKCGIAIVFLPHLKGSFLHGATFIDGKHIVLGLTVRGKSADKFWFSLFHELFHIIDGHINNPKTAQTQEDLADLFAKNTLIPLADYNEFISNKNFSEYSVIEFSKKINIAPGILVGRLQKENYIPFSFHNNLKTSYSI